MGDTAPAAPGMSGCAQAVITFRKLSGVWVCKKGAAGMLGIRFHSIPSAGWQISAGFNDNGKFVGSTDAKLKPIA